MTATMLPFDEALQAHLDMAPSGKGALAGAYERWFDSQVAAAIRTNANPDLAAIKTDVISRVGEWKEAVKATWDGSQKPDDQGVNISGEHAQGLMMSLLSGNFQGALMGLLMQLEPVKKFISVMMSVVGSWIGSKFDKDTEALSWSEAQEKLELDASLSKGVGALESAGLGSAAELAEALKNTPKESTSSSVTADKPPRVSYTQLPPGVGGVVFDPEFGGYNGSLVGSSGATPAVPSAPLAQRQ